MARRALATSRMTKNSQIHTRGRVGAHQRLEGVDAIKAQEQWRPSGRYVLCVTLADRLGK